VAGVDTEHGKVKYVPRREKKYSSLFKPLLKK
jgi:hypothetical protein